MSHSQLAHLIKGDDGQLVTKQSQCAHTAPAHLAGRHRQGTAVYPQRAGLGYNFSASWSVYFKYVGTGKARHDIEGLSFVRRYSSRVIYSVYFAPCLWQRD